MLTKCQMTKCQLSKQCSAITKPCFFTSGFRPNRRRLRRPLQLSPELPGGPDDAVPQRSGVRDASLREELPGCLEIRCTDSIRGILHADR